MKRNITVAGVTEADAGLERIKHLEEQLAAAPVNSHQYRTLSAAIRFEADAYRKSLDAKQATATHDGKRALGRGSFIASRTASLVAHPGIYRRKCSAPRAEHKPGPVAARRVRVPADTRTRKPVAEEKPDETKQR